MESMAAADQREGEGMTYGYDLECLVIALDNIENARLFVMWRDNPAMFEQMIKSSYQVSN